MLLKKIFRNVIVRCISIFLLSSIGAQADVTELAGAPMNFLVSSAVKPNIYFILDDSGSMVWSYAGDEVVERGYEKTVGYRSHRCNKSYYNPAVTYPVPVKSDGSAYAAQSFTAAQYDGFNSESVTVNLSSDFLAWRTAATDPPLPADTNKVKYRPDCRSLAGPCTAGEGSRYPNTKSAAYYVVYIGNDESHLGDGSLLDPCFDGEQTDRWRKVTVGENSGPGNSDERTNFANWYSYHRTRILTMKTALGRAFRDLDEQFRVGFSTIGDRGVADSPGFLKIADFNADHRASFYDKLYSINPASSTPLRAALSKAGRLYAGQLLKDADDPVQYSCQQNFTVLSTDGYWNTSWEHGEYGPKQIDGRTDVGDQDKDLPRPMADGNTGISEMFAAKITLSPDPGAFSNYAQISSIKVDGVELLPGTLAVNSPLSREASVTELAWNVETYVKRAGYRAIAQGPVVYIIPPALARPVSKPVINYAGAVIATVDAFREIAYADRRSNTLADIAAYYFQTDLRQPSLTNCGTTVDVCTNNVPVREGMPGGSHQHMITHTVGLGASGTLHYQEDYAESTTGDFRDIADGKRSWPDPIFFSGPERIDDLWHAAVNGGGYYLNAFSPEQLARALAQTLANIRATVGAAAAAATSSQEPAEGDSLLFGTRYRSIYWDGELEARSINLADGSVSKVPTWRAARELDKKVKSTSDTRTLWLQDRINASTLKRFAWNTLDANERAFFEKLCDIPKKLSQCSAFSSDEKSALTGEALVNYLRGHYGFEDRQENVRRLFRRREHVLGAPVNAQPLYVGRPAFRYSDDNYGEFRDKTQANRKSMVYVAANDGMLHAFNASTGAEEWAFIPSAVLPQMVRYADFKFSQHFSYLLDGTPVAGDICPTRAGATTTTCTAEQWRTVLVGGLGAAGREFYALDITDPAAPKALWRFGVGDNEDVGYALGRPLITKRRDGRWIVVLTSGYNNVNPGSGNGVLFVLDAYTGERLDKISTRTGSSTEPSGLAQVNGWVDNLMDNTSLRFYGGDLVGNVWRFDIDDRYPPSGNEAVLLARLVRDGVSQPVTTRPELSEVRVGSQRSTIVTIGTGSYLGLTDAKSKSVQSIYSFRDDLGESGYDDLRSKLVKQSLSSVANNQAERTVTANPVDWSSSSNKPGWFIDLLVDGKFTGERVTLDPDHQQGVLRIVTNTPDGVACRPGAESWIYEIDYLTGAHLPEATGKVLARRVASQSLTAGARTLKLGEKVITLVTDERGKVSTLDAQAPSASVKPVRRVSWRELDE